MSFYHELKRRNVFRVGFAYVITTWLIAQIAGLAAVSFFAPDWAMKMIITVLVLGFPVAMVMAWAYELTPEGLRRESEIEAGQSTAHVTASKLNRTITIALVVAVAYFSYDKFVLDPKRDAVMLESATQQLEAVRSEATSEDETGMGSEQSIAVLPFVNMSPDPDQEFFSDGMSEEILNLLAKIPGLKVIGRTSSFAFKGKNEDLRVIGQTLGVNTLLEGSVRKSGDRVRITAQLVDVSDGTHIWSETYDRTMTDIFVVQDDVAAAIIDALQIHVGANPTRGRPTENTQAYVLFLKARASLNSYEPRRAEELLLQAIERDLNFAEAFELLAFTYWAIPGDVVELQRLTGEAAGEALALNPDLILAQTLYQASKSGPGLHLRAIVAFERAARLQPDNPAILSALIFLLTEYGYLEEALRLSKRYIALDPLSLNANSYWAGALYAVGRTSEAVEALAVADQLGNTSENWFIGAVHLAENRDETAIAHFESYLQQRDDADSTWVRELVTSARDPTSGQAYLDRRIPEIVAGMPQAEALIEYKGLSSFYLYFGFLDRHFELILATKLSDSTWNNDGIHMWRGHLFRRLGFTAHPKFLEVAELMGIINVWEQRGPPDFCEKADGQWVCE